EETPETTEETPEATEETPETTEETPEATEETPETTEETPETTEETPETIEEIPETSEEATDSDTEAISDEELRSFAEVLLSLESLQVSYRAQSLAAVEDVGLSPERFDQILVLFRSPQAEGAEAIPDVTPEENQKFEQVLNQIGVIQTSIEDQAQQTILDQGFTFERFQEISTIVNGDETLEEQVRHFMDAHRSSES
ncbi:MAG: hypothetical protein AAF327_24150, partial [Cyanobacteria bacterium P01_A01_bin.37]